MGLGPTPKGETIASSPSNPWSGMVTRLFARNIARLTRNIARNTRLTRIILGTYENGTRILLGVYYIVDRVLPIFRTFLGDSTTSPCCCSNDYLFFFQSSSSGGIRQ